MAASTGKDVLSVDGLKALNSYFLYELIAIIVAIVLVVVLFAFIGSQLSSLSPVGGGIASPYSSSTPNIGLLVLVVIMYIVIAVLGVLATLGLMFGIRDLRRSTMKSAMTYASISSWLRKLIAISVVLSGILMVVLVFLVIAAFQAEISAFGGGAYSNPLSGILTYVALLLILAIALLIAELLFLWKLATFYKTLGGDTGQPALVTAGNLLMGVMALLVISVIIAVLGALSGGLAAQSMGTGNGILGDISLIINLVLIIISAASMFFGWKGTKAALDKML